MRIDEYSAHDATGLAALLRSGQVSHEEVYAVASDALRLAQEHLNVVADGPWDAPVEYSADGVFAGVPFILKDLGAHLGGVPTTMGTRLGQRRVTFERESHLIGRFREAGLAIAGLSTVPEFGMDITSEALVYGPSRSPWDPERSVGGSSGGTGALVAAGAIPIGHANDGGGSIRIPAACSGIVGLKPSRGRVPEGPDHQEVIFGLAAEFAHTRTMRDCAALLDAVAGSMPGDKVIIRDPARPWSQEVGADPGRLRIAVHTESWSGSPVDPEVAGAVERVGRELEGLGHRVERATPRFSYEAFIAAAVPAFAVFVAQLIDHIALTTGDQPSLSTLEHTTFAYYTYAKELTALDVLAALGTFNDISRTIGGFFCDWDVLLTPTIAMPPPPLGEYNANDPRYDAETWTRRIFDLAPFTAHFNVSGTPAISLPLGSTSGGLPIGVQLAARMGEEATLIRLGSQLEAAMPWRDRRPAFHVADREEVAT